MADRSIVEMAIRVPPDEVTLPDWIEDRLRPINNTGKSYPYPRNIAHLFVERTADSRNSFLEVSDIQEAFDAGVSQRTHLNRLNELANHSILCRDSTRKPYRYWLSQASSVSEEKSTESLGLEPSSPGCGQELRREQCVRSSDTITECDTNQSNRYLEVSSSAGPIGALLILISPSSMLLPSPSVVFLTVLGMAWLFLSTWVITSGVGHIVTAIDLEPADTDPLPWLKAVVSYELTR